MDHPFTADERRLIELWERHMSCEFAERDAAATVATMSGDNYVNHVPTMTGGRGREELLEFYGRHFIPKMPADTEIAPVCRTVGQGRVIDEIIFKFTHDTEMDWMLPGVPPTGKRVEVPLVVVGRVDPSAGRNQCRCGEGRNGQATLGSGEEVSRRERAGASRLGEARRLPKRVGGGSRGRVGGDRHPPHARGDRRPPAARDL